MTEHVRHVDILDTTLRDGSYTIGYQFTADETAMIARGLEIAGIDYIEIGHGLGLGADRAGKGSQAVTDLAYMRVCAGSIDKSKFGFFCIPGIGELSDLQLLADEGGKFVRIGVALETIDRDCHFIEAAKTYGLEVWANLMKTYAYSTKECKAGALRFVEAGAEGLYVVDSAGGMLPIEVAHYVSEIQEAISSADVQARIGFHGHDNLSLSTACSLSAIDAGCDIVDGSLLGIGRSIGNTATEVLAMVLSRAGYETGVKPWYAADLAEKTIRPFLEQRWRQSSLDQALGYAQIHSGFLPVLEKVAGKTGVSVRDIVLVLDGNARRDISEADATAAAEYVKTQAKAQNSGTNLRNKYIRSIEIPNGFSGAMEFDLTKYVLKIRSQSQRMARPSAIVIAGPWRTDVEKEISFQQIKLLGHVVLGAIEVSNLVDLERVVSEIDGMIEILFLDKSPRSATWNKKIRQLESRNWQSRMLPYADEVAGLIGACHNIAIEAGKRAANEVAVLGDDTRANMLGLLFPYWGLKIVEHDQASIMVIASKTEKDEDILQPGVELIFDLMSGVLNTDIVQAALTNGIEVIRLDGCAALTGEVIGLLDAQKLADQVMGRGIIDKVSVVAGGAWGREGDVVVNSIKNPTQAIGIADGNGGIKTSLCEADVRLLEKVKNSIREDLLAEILERFNV